MQFVGCSHRRCPWDTSSSTDAESAANCGSPHADDTCRSLACQSFSQTVRLTLMGHAAYRPTGKAKRWRFEIGAPALDGDGLRGG